MGYPPRPKTRTNISDSERKLNKVIEELRTKLNHINIRLLDCQNQNQMLRKEMRMARKVIDKELLGNTDKDFNELLNEANTSDFQGHNDKITTLQEKINFLQSRIKQIEDGNIKVFKDKKSNKDIQQREDKSKQIIEKEMHFLLEKSCQMKRKLDVWKKKSGELKKEREMLHLEQERLVEKSKEDKLALQSYRAVEKDLRLKQNEKLDLRYKLNAEKNRNVQLDEELDTLKNDLSTIVDKAGDENVLIDALKNQQDYLYDLLERQSLILQNDSWRFKEDLRDIQMKHASNRSTLEHLEDIFEQQNLQNQRIEEQMEDMEHLISIEDNEERGDSSISVGSDISQSNLPSPSVAESNSPNEKDDTVEPQNDEIVSLTEECELNKSLLWSSRKEKEQMSQTLISHNKKLKGWMSQLLQTRSLYSQKCAENRHLEETCKRLNKTSKRKNSSSPDTSLNSTDELIKKGDVLMEEYQFLRSLWDLLMSEKGNILQNFTTALDGRTKLFARSVQDLDAPIAEQEKSSHSQGAVPT